MTFWPRNTANKEHTKIETDVSLPPWPTYVISLKVIYHGLHHNFALLEQEPNHTYSGWKTSLQIYLFNHVYLSD